jgi:hypothetical protein
MSAGLMKSASKIASHRSCTGHPQGDHASPLLGPVMYLHDMTPARRTTTVQLA